MTVFAIYYNSTTGEIISYQQRDDVPSDSEIPTGCKLLALGRMTNIWDESGFRVNMKVDPSTLYLIPTNPLPILTQNPPSAENPVMMGANPNAEVQD